MPLYNQVKKILFFLFLVSINTSLIAQVSLVTDVGNNLILRPNIGVEKVKGKNGFGVLGMYKFNHGIWLSEFPSIYKAQGGRLDLYYFRQIKQSNFYVELLLRTQAIKANNLTEWRFDGRFNRKSVGSGVGIKLGYGKFKVKRVFFDISGGVGYAAYKNWDVVTETYGYPLGVDPIEYFRNQQLSKDQSNKSLRMYAFPNFQVKMNYRLKE